MIRTCSWACEFSMFHPTLSSLASISTFSRRSTRRRVRFAGTRQRGFLLCKVATIFGSRANSATDTTLLKYVEPAPLGSTEEPKAVVTTNMEYDTQQVRTSYRSQAMGLFMTLGVMHLYFKYTNPLLIQSILPIKSALESNLAKVYLFGQPAIGDLKRPWKAAGPFGMAGGDVKTDKKSVEAAEKSGRGGVKEE